MSTFAELGLKPELIRAIEELGFNEPMPIQEKVIPQVLQNHADLVGLAQTGTGKTAAFGLPLLQITEAENKHTQVLVLCPTRELCIQITEDLTSYTKYLRNIQVLAVYGGSSMETQIRRLKSGVHVIVATPGRMNDLLKRGKTDISNIHSVVLDEADEMLNMGFQEELNAILSKTPAEKQTLLFSATMPKEVAAIAANYMKEPVEISVGKRNAGAENVEHWFYMVHAQDRYLALKRIVDYIPDVYGIIFCRTRQETRDIAAKLMKDGYNADALHGELSQSQRDYVMQRFRAKELHMLVATDVAARGIDVNDLTHIINYNLPDELEVYTHRSGRTGRAGKKGICVSITNTREKHKIERLERSLQKKFIHKDIPTGKEICEKQLMNIIERMKNVNVDETQIDKFMPPIHETLQEMSREEIIKRFVSIEFNRFMEYYKNSPNLEKQSERKQYEGRSKDKRGSRDDREDRYGRERRSSKDGREDRFGRERRSSREGREGDGKRESFRKGREGEGKFVKLAINIGQDDGIKIHNLLGIINDCTRDRQIAIRHTKLQAQQSIFEVEEKHMQKVIKACNNKKAGGRTLKVIPA